MKHNDVSAERLELWWNEPDTFARDVWDLELDAWQVDVARAFPAHNNIAQAACKGPGKSFLMAILGLNFFFLRPYSKGFATSISGDNLADGLWTELATWISKSPLMEKTFEWTKTRITHRESPENWWLSARSWPKQADATQQAAQLAGLHGDYTLCLLDESGGYPESVMTTVEASQSTGVENKILQSGNPTHRSGPLFNAFHRDRSEWYRKKITADPDDPNRTPRVSVDYARRMINRWGRNSSWVKINILAEFPDSSDNQLLSELDIEAAMKRRVSSQVTRGAQVRLGIDVARFGSDATVLATRRGLDASLDFLELREAETGHIVGTALHQSRQYDVELQLVDGSGGYGGGVVDGLRAAGGNPIEVQFGGAAIDSAHYANRRSEMWFLMADWVRRGGSLPDDPQLARELAAPVYTYDARGRIQLESKDHIKQRIGYSPDRADALALTFALPEVRDGVSDSGLVLSGTTQPGSGGILRRDPSEQPGWGGSVRRGGRDGDLRGDNPLLTPDRW